jgi:hypothetical protein
VTRRTFLPACVAVLALALAGCGGSDSSEPAAGGSDSSAPTDPATGTSTGSSPRSSPTDSSATSPTGRVDGVKLTPQGTRLKLGDTARVSWQPDQKRTGVIAVTVDGLFRVPISAFNAWRLDRDTRRSTPYFVHATVRNLGKSDLSQVPVPLYLLDERETLLQASTFRAKFTPCPSRPLPPEFKRGDKAEVCLVYFAPQHGKLAAISFRPSEDFDAITWTGQVVTGQKQPGQKH